jgi:hypothetical protein
MAITGIINYYPKYGKVNNNLITGSVRSNLVYGSVSFPEIFINAPIPPAPEYCDEAIALFLRMDNDVPMI